jgi:APA family basic amino acid/polyamine antiporter
VAGVLKLRRSAPRLERPFRVPLYPLPPLLFITISGLSLVMVVWERPGAVAAALSLLVALGLLLWRLRRIRSTA